MAKTGNIVYLNNIYSDYVAQNGDVLRGKLNSNQKISIAIGATVTLDNAVIDLNPITVCKWAGLT